MPTVYNVLYKYLNGYKYLFLIAVMVILFIIVSFMVYKQMKTPISSVPFHNVANAQQRGIPIEIYFFYADWCPHCKTAKPEWEAFYSEFHGKTVNNQTVECISKNCTNDNDQDIQILMSDFKVDSFPHIVLVTNGSHIEFDAKITKASLEQFVLTVTN